MVVAPENSDPCRVIDGFTYENPCCPGGCAVAGAIPSAGPRGGGNTIQVAGMGFCSGFPEVMFGTEPALQVDFVSENILDVVVPASVTGTGSVDLIYRDASGCITLPCGGCYTYN